METDLRDIIKNKPDLCIWNIPTTKTVKYISDNKKDPIEDDKCITNCNGLQKDCDIYFPVKRILKYTKIKND